MVWGLIEWNKKLQKNFMNLILYRESGETQTEFAADLRIDRGIRGPDGTQRD